jgi:hypothetical protein
MNTLPKILAAAAIGVLLSAGVCFAGDFDGSRPLAGTTGRIVEIHRHRIDDDVDPDTIGLPHKFRIDFEAGTLRPSKDSVIRKTIVFNRVAHVENTIVLQGVDEGAEGVEDALAWSLVISKTDGKAVLSASGSGVAYVVFGRCTTAEGRAADER